MDGPSGAPTPDTKPGAAAAADRPGTLSSGGTFRISNGFIAERQMPRYSGYQAGAMVTREEEQRHGAVLVAAVIALGLAAAAAYVLFA